MTRRGKHREWSWYELDHETKLRHDKGEPKSLPPRSGSVLARDEQEAHEKVRSLMETGAERGDRVIVRTYPARFDRDLWGTVLTPREVARERLLRTVEPLIRTSTDIFALFQDHRPSSATKRALQQAVIRLSDRGGHRLSEEALADLNTAFKALLAIAAASEPAPEQTESK